MLKDSFLKFFILIFLLVPFISRGETVPITTSIPELDEQLYVNISNKFPRPLETVKIDIEAYGIDLNKATITWSVNGTVVNTGIGQKTFEVQTGKLGVTKKIGISIKPERGLPINKSVTLSPQELDLIWEARTYTPPFYRGKAMYTPQENVVIVALPNFISTGNTKLSSDKLIYNWSNEGDVAQEQSGYGKNTYKMKGDILMKTNGVSVEVTGFGKEKAKESVDLRVTFPEVVFYENNPLYGVLWNKSLKGSFSFTDEEKVVEAFPFYFGVFRKSDPKLSYTWRINNKDILVPKNQSMMTFRNTDKDSGSSLIGTTINNSSNFLSEADGGVNLNYSTSEKKSF